MKVSPWVFAIPDFKSFTGQPFPHISLDIPGRHVRVADADLFQRSEQIVDVLENRFIGCVAAKPIDAARISRDDV